MEYPFIDPSQLNKSHWKRIKWTLKRNDTEHTELTKKELFLIQESFHHKVFKAKNIVSL